MHRQPSYSPRWPSGPGEIKVEVNFVTVPFSAQNARSHWSSWLWVDTPEDIQKQAEHLDDALKAVQNPNHTQGLPRLGPLEHRYRGTAFYDAVYYTAKEMAGQPGRRAILLFSDGEENASAHNLMDTTEAAQEHSITIFSVRYTPRHRNGQPRFRCDGGPQSKTRLSTDLRNAACQLRSGLLNQSAHE